MHRIIGFMAAAMLAAGAQAMDSYKVIDCGTVLDVEREQALSKQQILVKNAVIEAIGAGVTAPVGAERIDLSNQVCLPGLMDTHVHLFIDTTKASIDASAPTQSSAANALMGLKNTRTLLNSGFTTIRVPGDADYHYAGIELRDAIERGDFVGPRMLVAPHAISPTGGHGDFNSYAPDLPHRLMGPKVADGVAAIRLAVREEIKYGADWIKVMASGGVMSQHDDPEVAAYTAEEFRTFADEAHRHKKKITAHAHGDVGIRAAVEAGFDAIEHGTMMEPETAKLMASRGTFYVPTLYVADWILERGRQGGITANNLEKAMLVNQKHSDSVRLAVKYGVPLALGSDPIFPMEESIREFNAMARRIDDKWLVLQAGTINSAKMLGLDDQIGSLSPGKQADIVAMPNSPLEDMRNIEQVNFVMKGGVVVRQP